MIAPARMRYPTVECWELVGAPQWEQRLAAAGMVLRHCEHSVVPVSGVAISAHHPDNESRQNARQDHEALHECGPGRGCAEEPENGDLAVRRNLTPSGTHAPSVTYAVRTVKGQQLWGITLMFAVIGPVPVTLSRGQVPPKP